MAREQPGRLVRDTVAVRLDANIEIGLTCIPRETLKHDLRDYTEVLKHKRPFDAPFSTLVTLVAVVVTSESNDVLLTSSVWDLVFRGLSAGAFIWGIIYNP